MHKASRTLTLSYKVHATINVFMVSNDQTMGAFAATIVVRNGLHPFQVRRLCAARHSVESTRLVMSVGRQHAIISHSKQNANLATAMIT
jgi:hypothetical protein